MSVMDEHRVVVGQDGSPFHPYSLENEAHLTRFFPTGTWEKCECPTTFDDED